MPDAPAPARREPTFEHLPSVGAWLTPLLASHWQDTSPAEPKQMPGDPASVRREPVFEHLPSVGAWLTPLLAGPWQLRLAASDLEAPAEAPEESFFPPVWPAAATERRPPPPEAKEMDLNVLSTHPAGPKYSMAPLIGKKSGSDEVGPGKYAEVKAEQDKYSKPPCWSIGNPAKDGLWGDGKDAEKLEKPEIDESGVPGPGQYFPVDQSPYSPKFGFGSRRKDPKPATCPGPGQYELKSTLQDSPLPATELVVQAGASLRLIQAAAKARTASPPSRVRASSHRTPASRPGLPLLLASVLQTGTRCRSTTAPVPATTTWQRPSQEAPWSSEALPRHPSRRRTTRLQGPALRRVPSVPSALGDARSSERDLGPEALAAAHPKGSSYPINGFPDLPKSLPGVNRRFRLLHAHTCKASSQDDHLFRAAAALLEIVCNFRTFPMAFWEVNLKLAWEACCELAEDAWSPTPADRGRAYGIGAQTLL
eukprot:s1643_g2.t2